MENDFFFKQPKLLASNSIFFNVTKKYLIYGNRSQPPLSSFSLFSSVLDLAAYHLRLLKELVEK